MGLLSSRFKFTRNRGDTFRKSLKVYTDKTKTELQDCTGWEFKVTIRNALPSTETTTDEDSGVIAQDIITGDSSGIHEILFSSSDLNIDAGEYYMDIQTKKSNGDIKSTPYGYLIIEPDITRSS